ncbi:ribokinase [Streptosporangium becharense]|uniref:Ribokinase n=1 Tax=Streptosporangium becharense TaxID=1816182 RepID=A0A7W9IL58_9ACTN|nr:ribokinase [Streptosporangium becharense]MBB2915160.1 ribokinase [Streptosporangium becharense]MBB5822768.1 ribokinase [Streptosporangium becharense]
MISVFGSVNMDLVAYVEAAPAPGETVTGHTFGTIPGGKGANQAIAAARAGAEVAFLGAVGDDSFGPELRRTLAGAGVDVTNLRTVPGPSGIAHIVVEDGGGNSIIVVPGANGTMTAPSATDVEVISRSEILLLQLELPIEAVTAAARAARAAGTTVVLTPAPVQPLPAELLEAVDVLVANEHEAIAITGQADHERAMEELRGRVGWVIVTLGSRGALTAESDGQVVHVEARRVTAVDTTAAGDTFVGALAAARAEGQRPDQAVRFATAAAALSVQRAGASTSMPTRAEIDRSLGGAGV